MAILHCGVGGRRARVPVAWCLAMFLNRYLPAIPPGTLAANLIGCYIIGIALAIFTAYTRILHPSGGCSSRRVFAAA